MKVVFAGTPEFAAAALAALIEAGHEIVLAMTQPDRPSGRGMQVRPSAVKALSVVHGIPVIQPRGLRLGGRYDDEATAAHTVLRSTPHDVMVVAAYGLILPPTVLAIPPLGCINIHASLLPRWRGAAPIQRAIEAGDALTGITIMQMDAGLDTGAMLSIRSVPIAPTDTGGSLTDRLARLGGEAIVDALPKILAGTLRPQPQGESQVTYAAKLAKSESALDFTMPSAALVDRVRAFDPWPGCSAEVGDATGLRSSTYKIWRAQPVAPPLLAALTGKRSRPAVAGELLEFAESEPTGDGAVFVATGDGAVALTELQKPGGKRLAARHFARDFAAPSATLHFGTGAASGRGGNELR